jgi:hypothetical protein
MKSDMSNAQVPDLGASTSGGTGNGIGNRRNRRGGRGNKLRNSYTSSNYEGSEPSLKGHAYYLQDEKTNDQLFVKTTKEVVSWVGREYSTYTELCKAVETLILVDPVQPTNPAVEARYEGVYYVIKGVQTLQTTSCSNCHRTMYPGVGGPIEIKFPIGQHPA